jgi:type VI secretion system protein ImpK
VIAIVLNLRAGNLAASTDLRPKVAQLLKEMEQRAATVRYSERQVKSVTFALAAFVDETVLTANFPLREEWERVPLQLEYFGEHLAGVKFFERLDELLKQVEADADVVEVYYLCMLLGFKGRYKVYMEDQLQGVIENTAAQLRRVGRLQETELSPHWKVTDQPEPPSIPGLPLFVKLGAVVGFFFVVLIYLVLQLVLHTDLSKALNQLLR